MSTLSRLDKIVRAIFVADAALKLLHSSNPKLPLNHVIMGDASGCLIGHVVNPQKLTVAVDPKYHVALETLLKLEVKVLSTGPGSAMVFPYRPAGANELPIEFIYFDKHPRFKHEVLVKESSSLRTESVRCLINKATYLEAYHVVTEASRKDVWSL